MKWEYKTIKLETTGFSGGDFDDHGLDDHLNQLGEQGWELVSALDTSYFGGASHYMVAILKRNK